MNVIEVENLTYSYDKNEIKAVNSVSFSVPQGKYVTLIGHNGSGKSTLAKLLSGLITSYEGKISLFGEAKRKEYIVALKDHTFYQKENTFTTKKEEAHVFSFYKEAKAISRVYHGKVLGR